VQTARSPAERARQGPYLRASAGMIAATERAPYRAAALPAWPAILGPAGHRVRAVVSATCLPAGSYRGGPRPGRSRRSPPGEGFARRSQSLIARLWKIFEIQKAAGD